MLNQITLMGRLTKDPSISHPDYTTATLAHFTLAVDRDIKAKDGSRKTDFIQCNAWGSTADFAGKYFKKGQMALVTGRLEITPYASADGTKGSFASVRVSSLYFADSKKDGQAPAAPSPAHTTAPGQFSEITNEDDGDLPF